MLAKHAHFISSYPRLQATTHLVQLLERLTTQFFHKRLIQSLPIIMPEIQHSVAERAALGDVEVRLKEREQEAVKVPKDEVFEQLAAL